MSRTADQDRVRSQVIGLADTGVLTPVGLDRLLSVVACAAVILRVAPDRPDVGADHVAALVRAAQSHGAAALIESDARLALRVGADGVHIPCGADALAAYRAARALLGADASIGADAGLSRHAAMEIGELGADYIAFGLRPHGAPGAVEAASAVAQREDLIAWWADLFEVPCVALDVESDEAAGRLLAAGADFVVRRLDDTIGAQPGRSSGVAGIAGT